MSDWPDATELARRVSAGEVQPVELVDLAIETVERLDPTLNAVITPLFDKARASARGAIPDGRFRGVPMVLKDFVCHSQGDPFFEGMAFLKALRWHESQDTELAARYRRAGFIVIGKTNTSELGMSPDTRPAAFGPTRNPWNTAYSPMGSSGGTAAAVAAGMVPLGYANDGGGSIRLPAGACGLFGLKPSRGRVSHGPEFGDLFGGFVSEHVITRTVRDSAGVLDVTAGPMPGEPYHALPPRGTFLSALTRPRSPLRIGVWDELSGMTLAPAASEAVERTAALLLELGHRVERSKPAPLGEARFRASFITHFAAGTAWILDHYWPRHTGRHIAEADVEPITWKLAEKGRRTSASDYMAAREDVQLYARDVARWWASGFDLLLTPTMPRQPPLADTPASLAHAAFAVPFNATGQPAASLPVHRDLEGLPVGIQLVAELGREDLIFQVAAELEEATDWPRHRPPL